jgi:hypothetical protein
MAARKHTHTNNISRGFRESANGCLTVNGGITPTEAMSTRSVMCLRSFLIDLTIVSTITCTRRLLERLLTSILGETGSGGRCPGWDKPTEEPDLR